MNATQSNANKASATAPKTDYSTLRVGMMLRNAKVAKGPKYHVTFAGAQHAVAVHPDCGALRIYPTMMEYFTVVQGGAR